MFTQLQIAVLPKIIAIAGGSGVALLAQVPQFNAQHEAVQVYGGWGVAVTGLIFLWKDNKALRAEARADRDRFDAEREAREKAAHSKDEEFKSFTQECTSELRRMRKSNENVTHSIEEIAKANHTTP